MSYPLDAAARAAADRPDRLLLRSDADWEADLRPKRVSRDRQRFDFELPEGEPFRYFKPVLRRGEEVLWAQGPNQLAHEGGSGRIEVHPYFVPDASCHVCDRYTVPSSFQERGWDVRVFLPAGYDENPLERFPVLYVQDGQNVFFADEAFGGSHWRMSETLEVLGAMNRLRRLIVVGVYPDDRQTDYTAPGYGRYGRFVADELVPWVASRYRTLAGPSNTAVLGSSLGGVVSLHLALAHPEVFGGAACLSSTFGWHDDLRERVLEGGKRPVRLYLDSGWPSDNYEVTLGMTALLRSRGWVEGQDLFHIAFPDGRHDEASWARRLHVPLQFFFRRA